MAASAPFRNPLVIAARAEMIARITREVERVGEIILEASTSRSPMVENVIRHTLSSGGKRLRPAFVLLAARAINPDVPAERLLRLGACMEMVHMATLVHDDVVDNAETRRGNITAGVTFGNTASILSGDVLLAKAMELLAEDGDLG
ncbi:MAG: polyprenyl synthetase, partial [Armatimonadota bacterium]